MSKYIIINSLCNFTCLYFHDYIQNLMYLISIVNISHKYSIFMAYFHDFSNNFHYVQFFSHEQFH
jgi:hypothetical protein